MRPLGMLLAALVVLAIVPGVLAVGLTPASQHVDYKAGSTISGKIKVVGSGQMFISSSDPRLELAQNYVTGDTVVDFTVRMQNFDPGATPITITASQVTAGGMISSEAQVEAKVIVDRPVSGSFATFQVFPPKEGADSFYVKVQNKGLKDIVELQAVIDVTAGKGQLSRRFTSPTRSLKAGEQALLEVPVQLQDGAYDYDASITYDGAVKRSSGSFVLGKPEVAYTGFVVRSFNLGAINEFVVTLDNRFNRQVLTDVSVGLEQNGATIDRFSQQVLLDPNDERALSAYIDTSRAVEGPATLSVEVSHDGTTRTRDDPITLAKDQVIASGQVTGSGGGKINIVLLLVLIGVIINGVLVYLLFRRRNA